MLALWSNHNLGLFFLRYSVKLGENTLSLPGCHHMCKKEIEERKCCPGFWGTECYGKFWGFLLQPLAAEQVKPVLKGGIKYIY